MFDSGYEANILFSLSLSHLYNHPFLSTQFGAYCMEVGPSMTMMKNFLEIDYFGTIVGYGIEEVIEIFLIYS